MPLGLSVLVVAASGVSVRRRFGFGLKRSKSSRFVVCRGLFLVVVPEFEISAALIVKTGVQVVLGGVVRRHTRRLPNPDEARLGVVFGRVVEQAWSSTLGNDEPAVLVVLGSVVRRHTRRLPKPGEACFGVVFGRVRCQVHYGSIPERETAVPVV